MPPDARASEVDPSLPWMTFTVVVSESVTRTSQAEATGEPWLRWQSPLIRVICPPPGIALSLTPIAITKSSYRMPQHFFFFNLS